MADLADNSTPINDLEVSADAPLTEALLVKMGGDINYLLRRQWRKVDFSASGTWVCPANVTDVLLLGAGGGGAGGGQKQITYGAFGFSYGGAGGNSGEWGFIHCPVTPTLSYAVTIGSGGSGVNNANGNSGTDTTFGGIRTFKGGGGGGIYVDGSIASTDMLISSPQGRLFMIKGSNYGVSMTSPKSSHNQSSGGWTGANPRPYGALTFPSAIGSEPGQSAPGYAGGLHGNSALGGTNAAYSGGGGGASIFGAGANAGTSVTSGAAHGVDASATAYGAGGGGSGGSGNATASRGGNGAGGFLSIYYYGVP